MGTKANPGKYDCHAHAAPDEPLFTFVGHDPIGSHLVAIWVALRAGDSKGAHKIIDDALEELRRSRKPLLPYDSEKSIEAQQCSKDMAGYYLGKTLDAIEKRLATEESP